MNCGRKTTDIWGKGVGFTIIETVIVLTIVALTILIAISQLQGRTNEIRFRDSAVQLESALNQQIAQISQGADLSAVAGQTGCGDTTVASSEQQCVFAGKVIEFEKNTSEYTIHTMLGGLNVLDAGEARLSKNLFEAQPSSRSQAVARMDWQLEYIGAPVSVNGLAEPESNTRIFIGFFRLPRSTEVFPIVFSGVSSGTAPIDNQANYSLASAPGSSSSDNFSAELCFSGINGDEVKVLFGAEDRNDVITIDRDFKAGECMVS